MMSKENAFFIPYIHITFRNTIPRLVTLFFIKNCNQTEGFNISNYIMEAASMKHVPC